MRVGKVTASRATVQRPWSSSTDHIARGLVSALADFPEERSAASEGWGDAGAIETSHLASGQSRKSLPSTPVRGSFGESRFKRLALLHRGAPMAISILNDLLLFSILVSVVTGIVIAAASLLV
jgi:hypothetical protein